MRRLLLPIACLSAAPASAAVTGVSADGFRITLVATTPAAPAKVYATIGRVDRWWNPVHSYSGNAANLSLVLAPGGCFCERLPQGPFNHLTVIAAQPKHEVRLSGTLGPLRQLARTGELVIRLDPLDRGTRITMTYQVGGVAAGKAQQLAPAVDGVLGEQLSRLAAAAPRS